MEILLLQFTTENLSMYFSRDTWDKTTSLLERSNDFIACSEISQ